jgi:uncharacterized protein YndB with AHSA1/START domain
MTNLPHTLDRTVHIGATPDTVFRYFTDSQRWASWWGKGSTIDPRVGGRVYVVHPGGVEMAGEVIEIDAPRRIVFTYGYMKNPAIPVGGSRVTIRLDADPAGTQLRLHHEFAEAAPRDEHIQGWRFQLSLFGNVVSAEVNASATQIADAWFDAWAEPNQSARDATLRRIASPDVSMRDQYTNLETIPELSAHMGAAQRFMPGVRLTRASDVRHCQGVALADWVATGPDGAERMRGTNVFVFGPTGMIESVTGIASPPGQHT